MPPRPINPDTIRYWSELAGRLRAVGQGARGAIIAEAQAAMGLSRNTVYERLRTYGGWESGRARRSDAGRTALPADTLDLIAGMQRESTRNNGKRLMSIELAASIAAANGREIGVSISQIGRQLRAHRLDQRGLAQAQTFVQMRSLHPNHVHQADPSLCVLFYLKGKQQILREAEFYKNKLEGLARIKYKVWRYVLTDHFSSLIRVRYVESAGETAANLGDFLLWAWSKQAGITGHGAPRLLVVDPGSANTSAPIRGLLDALDVELYAHGPECPWVKGQVERANDLIERQFESRLRFEPVADIDALNAAADTWSERYNRNLIDGQDTRLSRPGVAPIARADLWLRIRPDQLRELPPVAVCRRYLEGRRSTVKINSQLQLQFRHPAADHRLVYDIRGCEGLHRGDAVEVAPLICPEPGEAYPIRIHWTGPAGQTATWRVGADVARDAAGFQVDGPVWAETYRTNPKGEAQRNAERLDAQAYPAQVGADKAGRTATEQARKARQKGITPFSGEIKAHSHLGDTPTPAVLPRRGTPIAPAGADAPEAAPTVGLVAALLRLADAWGRPVTPEENKFLRARYPAGVPEDDLCRLAAAAGSEDHGAAAVPTGATRWASK